MRKYLKWTTVLLGLGLILLLTLFVLAASSPTVYRFLFSEAARTQCYGLSVSEALRNVMRDYYSEPASTRSGPASKQMRLSKERLIGVGRSNYPKDSDNVIQLWFLQDDGTLTVASYFEDCDFKFSPNNSRSSMDSAAYPVRPPSITGPEAVTNTNDSPPSRK